MEKENYMPLQAVVIPQMPEMKKGKKHFTRSLEYDLIASLAFHKYATKEGADFEQLLAIPLKDRIPGLIIEYGVKRMHQLIRTMLHEFCSSIQLPKSKKLTETKTSVCSCDLMLAAQEDHLSLEDLIVFFEFSRSGNYGKFKSVLTHFSIMEKLETYRQQRYEKYISLKEQKETAQKSEGPADRVSPEPTSVKDLFEKQGAKIVPFKKIS
ncbi:MAG: hypothetical protein ACJ75F_07020 [Flavisolibacter sp.]